LAKIITWLVRLSSLHSLLKPVHSKHK